MQGSPGQLLLLGSLCRFILSSFGRVVAIQSHSVIRPFQTLRPPLSLYNIEWLTIHTSPLLPRFSPNMADEKEQAKFEETISDHAANDERGGVIDEKLLLRKLDWHVIPGPTLLLLLSFMDRGNGNSLFLLISITLISFQLGTPA